MDPTDPAIKYGINNFEQVNLNDSPQWGNSYDIAKIARDRNITTVQRIRLPIANFKLDRHKTEPLDWVINFRREFKSGTNSSSALFGPQFVYGSLLVGGGNFSYETTWNGPPLPVGWGVASTFAFVPPYGCAWHVNCEALTVWVEVDLNPVFVPLLTRVDKIIGWISRGRPSTHVVTKFLISNAVTPTPITIPEGAISCKIAGFQNVGGTAQPRANTTVVFTRIMPEAPAVASVGSGSYQFTVQATDNNNEIMVPMDSYSVFDGNGAANTVTLLSFTCVT